MTMGKPGLELDDIFRWQMGIITQKTAANEH